MSTKIDYFGDYVSGIVISVDKLSYIQSAGIEILTCEIYEPESYTSVGKDYKAFYITFKVNSMTFLHFYHAGINYQIDKYYKL
jgi:hypothetical protein